MSKIKLGVLLDDTAKKDAVHMCIAPVVAGETLKPGQQVWMAGLARAYPVREGINGIGVVDPFLKADVNKDEMFYILLNPDSISNLRHEWEHPDFPFDYDDAYSDSDGCRSMGCD